MPSLESSIKLVQRGVDVVITVGEGEFLLSGPLTIERPINIRGLGASLSQIIAPESVRSSFVNINNPEISELIPLSSLEGGSLSIEVQPLSYLGEDCNQLMIRDKSKLWPHDIRDNVFYGEIVEVDTVDGSTLKISEPLRSSYSPDHAQLFLMCDFDVAISDLGVSFKKQALGSKAIAVKGASSVTIQNVRISKSGRVGIFVENSVDVEIRDNALWDGFPVGCRTCYGIQTYGTQDVLIDGNEVNNYRRGIDVSGEFPSRRVRVVSNVIRASSDVVIGASGLGTHGSAVGVLFFANRVYGGVISAFIRGTNIDVQQNHFIDSEWIGVLLGSGGSHLVKENKIGGIRRSGRATDRGIEFSVPMNHGSSFVQGNIMDTRVGGRIKAPPTLLVFKNNSLSVGGEEVIIDFDESLPYELISESWMYH